MTNVNKINDCNQENTSEKMIIIIGAGGHAISVANVALSAGYAIKHFVDKNKSGSDLLGFKIISDIENLKDPSIYSYAIAVGDNNLREHIYEEHIKKLPTLKFPQLIHKSAIVSKFVEIGEGTVMMPLSIIGPNSSVGKFCIINTHSSIDHDCAIDDYSSIAPSATTGGNVRIGLRSAISIGAKIKHGVKIGDDCVIGGNSYLNNNLPNNIVAYGTPAKVIRERSRDEQYL
jgi:sugar O-acyltransferase (sialic acid O-acetyltransferase NeuD family)